MSIINPIFVKLPLIQMKWDNQLFLSLSLLFIAEKRSHLFCSETFLWLFWIPFCYMLIPILTWIHTDNCIPHICVPPALMATTSLQICHFCSVFFFFQLSHWPGSNCTTFIFTWPAGYPQSPSANHRHHRISIWHGERHLQVRHNRPD